MNDDRLTKQRLARIRKQTIIDRYGGKEGRSSVGALDVEELLAEVDLLRAALEMACRELADYRRGYWRSDGILDPDVADVMQEFLKAFGVAPEEKAA